MSPVIGLVLSLLCAADAPPPIQTVAVGPNREFLVNGKPFFPIMVWLQGPENFARVKEINANSVAGYWPGSGGTKDVVGYLKLVETAGMYGVMPYHERLKGNPALLAYIHDDEPDLSHLESDATVDGGPGMRLNDGTPLWRIVDGDVSSWSVLDPLEGASLTIKLRRPVTVERLAVSLTVSAGLAVARQVTFVAGGAQLARVELENRAGRQEIKLPQPATLSDLAVHVNTTYPGKEVWGSLGEVEGFDAAGKNVLLSRTWRAPRQSPAQAAQAYQTIHQSDASRPVCLTLTADFMPASETWPPEKREQLYAGYARAADVLGFDIYPLYGWGRPDWLHRVSEGTAQLRALAGGKPVYAWIETSKGSQWVSEDRQPDVKPEHIRAEVWMALCQGATAIGYFTHVWKPTEAEFGVPPENVKALAEINAQITRLAPVLLAPEAHRKVTLDFGDGRQSDVTARETDQGLYVFAVNSDAGARPGRGTITVQDLAAGQTVEAVDENRTLTSEAGQFRDDFAPLAVHIYRVK
jgi:hypothetical protein